MLSKIGFKLGISPSIISTKLLNQDDKNDMLNGDLTPEILELHVKLWMDRTIPPNQR